MKKFFQIAIVTILVIMFLVMPSGRQRFRQKLRDDQYREARYKDSLKKFQQNFMTYDTTKKSP